MGSNNELYQQILGLSLPWKVVDVRLEVEGQAVHISLDHYSESRFNCPKCEREYGCYDHAPRKNLAASEYLPISDTGPCQCSQGPLRGAWCHLSPGSLG